MHEYTIPDSTSKEEIYEAILPQVEFLFQEEKDLIANISNAIALLKSTSLPYFWIGFYLVKGNDLVLGPFQGLPATARIGYGLGVCGASWKERKTFVVPDVHLFPGHIACNCDSQSEIVVPVFSGGEVVAVLDIDSDHKDDFDQTDARYLEKLATIIGKNWTITE